MPALRAIPVKYRSAETKVKAVLPTLIAEIVSFQAAYFATHGRYWQGLSTHAAVPDEKTPKAADETTRAPADRRSKELVSVDAEGNPTYKTVEDDTWADTKIALTDVCSISVSDYNGPLGHGYVVTAEIKVGTETVVVVRPFGPETYRKSESTIRAKLAAVAAESR